MSIWTAAYEGDMLTIKASVAENNKCVYSKDEV